MRIEETLFARLSSDSVLTSFLNDRIYPDDIPDDEETLPWLRYVIRDVEPTHVHGHPSGKAIFAAEFEVYTRTYTQGRSIADAIRTRLDTWQGGEIDRAFYAGESHDAVDGGYLVTVRFNLHGMLGVVIPSVSAVGRVTADGTDVELLPDGTNAVLRASVEGVLLKWVSTVPANPSSSDAAVLKVKIEEVLQFLRDHNFPPA